MRLPAVDKKIPESFSGVISGTANESALPISRTISDGRCLVRKTPSDSSSSIGLPEIESVGIAACDILRSPHAIYHAVIPISVRTEPKLSRDSMVSRTLSA